ncbi:TetR/AcrR family transcriptional regulator [Nocardia abscessus]|uniref:TetR/AcrR family transcriptional regulator n=1 Tax=Nocardia abscessus TaxID=120957 RepID=UPI0003027489|nr:TetR family transcriptional regulator [Nocardia abscessus]MCC3332180.1 TetR family transcriptional regulator [Nocardia abscessus]
MPRTPEAAATARAATRTRIRTAAILLMAEQGFNATTLRQIAARAGVADGLPSHYFGSKNGLLIDIADHWRDRTRAALTEQRNDGPEARLRLLVRSALRGLGTTAAEVEQGRATAALLADPQVRRVLRAAGADDESADLLAAVAQALHDIGSPDPEGDQILLIAAIRGGLSLAAEDPSFPLCTVEDALLGRLGCGADSAAVTVAGADSMHGGTNT